jgi:hypothetical protein
MQSQSQYRSRGPTYRSSRLLLGLGPIGVALVTPGHGGRDIRMTKEKEKEARRRGGGAKLHGFGVRDNKKRKEKSRRGAGRFPRR